MEIDFDGQELHVIQHPGETSWLEDAHGHTIARSTGSITLFYKKLPLGIYNHGVYVFGDNCTAIGPDNLTTVAFGDNYGEQIIASQERDLRMKKIILDHLGVHSPVENLALHELAISSEESSSATIGDFTAHGAAGAITITGGANSFVTINGISYDPKNVTLRGPTNDPQPGLIG